MRDFMQLDEIRAFFPQLLSTNEIPSARCQSAATAGNIETIEPGQTKASMKKFIGLLLKPAVRTGDDQRMRSLLRPFSVHLQALRG